MKLVALSLLSLVLLACGEKAVTFNDDASSGGGGGSGISLDAGDSGSVPDGSDPCLPKTCEDLNANCGTADNGCGGTISCGQCAEPDICGVELPNVCGVLPCAEALEDPSKVPGLTGFAASDYQAVLDCVCHDGETTNQCSYDPASQSMCATNTVTWDFLTMDPIGPCVAQYCDPVIWTCLHGNF